MNPRNLTRSLGALAAALAVVLTAVLLQQPRTDTGTPAVAGSATQDPPPQHASADPTPTLPTDDPDAEGGPSGLPGSEVDARDASPGATPYSQTGEARHRWEPVADGFGRAFTATRGKDAATWRTSLAPYVTGKVRVQLVTVTDLRKVPNGRFIRIKPVEYGEDKVAVLLHYDTGPTLVIYLILDDTQWRIYAYDRWEE